MGCRNLLEKLLVGVIDDDEEKTIRCGRDSLYRTPSH